MVELFDMNDKWTESDIPDLTGKVIIITGANAGLGIENTRQFSEKGATVIMACRNLEKGRKAMEKVLAKNTEAKLDLIQLDLADQSSIKTFVQKFTEKYDRLDVLLNNAGNMN